MKYPRFERDRKNMVKIVGNPEDTLESTIENMSNDINNHVEEEKHESTKEKLIEAYENGGVYEMVSIYIEARKYIERLKFEYLTKNTEE